MCGLYLLIKSGLSCCKYSCCKGCCHIVQAVALVAGPGSSANGLKMNLGKITVLNAGKVIWLNIKEK